MLKFGTLHVSRHRAFTGDEDLALEVESQNVPSWNRPIGIIKSHSWLHTALPKPHCTVGMRMEPAG